MTSDQMAPPGWYDNPEKAGEVRLWDGAAWTDETRPKAPPMPPPAAFAPSSTGFDHSYPTEQPLGAAQSYGAAAVSYGIASGPGPAQPGSGGAQSFGLGGGYQAPQAFTQAGPGPGFGQATNWGPASRAKWGTPHGPGRGIRRVGSLAYMAFAVVFGLIWVAVGLLLLHADSTPSGQTATATGIVTSVSATIGADSGCRPTATFTIDGTQYTASTNMSVAPCPWSDGQVVTVRYNPSNPAESSIPVSGAVSLLPWFFIVIGLFVVVVSIVSTMRTRARIAAGTYVPRSRSGGLRRLGISIGD